jgi:hypothetical protein
MGAPRHLDVLGDLDQLERSYRQLKQGMYATGLVFNRTQLNVMDRIDRGERFPEPMTRSATSR